MDDKGEGMGREDRQAAGEGGQGILPRLLEELERGKAGGDVPGVGWAPAKVGTFYQTQVKNREALSFFEESLRIFQDLADRPGEASVSALMGHLLYQQGAWDRALESLDRARRLQE